MTPAKYTFKIIGLLCMACLTVTSMRAQQVLKVQPGVVIACTGGVVITLNNISLDNSGIISQTTGQGSFVFNGNTDNTISGSASPLFDVLEIAKTGSAKLTLQQGIQVGSGITFTSGNIDLNTQNILLQPTALLNGESESSHITGTSGGYVQITTVLNAPSGVNAGNLGAVITSAQNLGSTIIRRGHVSQTNAASGGSSILRYYDIIPTNDASLNASLRMMYLDAELNGLDESSLVLMKSTDTVTWTNKGYDSRNTTTNYVEKAGLADFSRWTLSSPANALPLVWGIFNTQCVMGGTHISWTTLQEQNTAFFVVRRSTDGATWAEIARIPAAGNSQTTSLYAYTDPQSPAGACYYQVIQEDINDRQTLSPVLRSRCGAPESIKVYPNPVQQDCWVNIQSNGSDAITMRLYDAGGALLKQQALNVQTGSNQFALSLNGFTPGSYSLVVTWSDGKVNVIKLQKY